MTDTIHYVVRNDTTGRWIAKEGGDHSGAWTTNEHQAQRWDDQTGAEHYCDQWRDYFASKGFGYEIAVIEVTTVDGLASDLAVY